MVEASADVSLVQAVAAGDRGALGDLYDRHASTLMGVGMRILKNRQETEDIVHDVFLEVWKRAHTYDPTRASVRSWLLLRMRSRSLDRVKSAAVSRRRPMDSVPEKSTRNGATETHVDAARLGQWMVALSDEQRAVVQLGYLEGLSSGEMASRLSIPVGTVKSRLASALRVLRRHAGGGAA